MSKQSKIPEDNSELALAQTLNLINVIPLSTRVVETRKKEIRRGLLQQTLKRRSLSVLPMIIGLLGTGYGFRIISNRADTSWKTYALLILAIVVIIIFLVNTVTQAILDFDRIAWRIQRIRSSVLLRCRLPSTIDKHIARIMRRLPDSDFFVETCGEHSFLRVKYKKEEYYTREW